MPNRIKTPALMFQGTCSNAGKSLLTAGLCRHLWRQGIKAAPFKAQNMSLNSYVTPAGGEIGRAQALQAAACGLEPDARMNPVLLKPMANNKSQIIVMGKPIGIMNYGEYVKLKPEIWKKARAAYKSLAAEADIMILEGAGSPAEINLRANDIVNMRMAHAANAKVFLIADIDRGGAFAALAGTMALLNKSDRKLVAGYILNKFRGDKSLLRSALDIIEKKTRRPFFGIMPMLDDLSLPDEDSVSFKNAASRHALENALDIAIIDLPSISNVTDCDPLGQEDGVCMRKVRAAGDLGSPHLVILPGSRNVFADMNFLQGSGLAMALINYAQKSGATIVGICGGMQLLGAEIADPDGLEGGCVINGLGLLDIRTNFGREKILERVEGRISIAGGHKFRGYEIHHGRTLAFGKTRAIAWAGGQERGWGNVSDQGAVWGLYPHGVFDSDEFRHEFLAGLRQKANLPPQNGKTWNIDLNLDRLADALAENLDLDAMLKR